ncbi:MAG: hypothetical protein MRERC_4c089 [Mycoplasmataceae bacterium RC_NB112A]|nr:MAG: hypothetical protein MRERC_4c089 [Mycoplasmataceae bacterium RC_NB112A]
MVFTYRPKEGWEKVLINRIKYKILWMTKKFLTWEELN